MKITYINEAVRFPARQAKLVSLTDIQTITLNSMRQYICGIINEEFKNITGYDIIDLFTLKQRCLHYSNNEFEYNISSNLHKHRQKDDSLDFSPGISIKPDNTGRYIVYLYISCTTQVYLYADINKFLNDICSRHSDLISDIRLKSICLNGLTNGASLSQDVDVNDIETYIKYNIISYPLSRVSCYPMNAKNVTTEITNEFIIVLSSTITNDQWKNIIEYTLRFDDVTNEGIECRLDINNDMTLSNTITALKKIANDVFPKFKFKFSKIYVKNNKHDIVISLLKENIFSNVFNKQNISNFAHDVNKFYVKLNYKIICEYIKTNAKFYMPKCTQERKTLICNMFYYITYHSYILVHNKIDIGYYPILDKLGFIHIDDAGLSPEDMFVPIDKVLDFIIKNAINPNVVTNEDIKDCLYKLFNLK